MNLVHASGNPVWSLQWLVVFSGEHAVFMWNFIVRGAGKWLLHTHTHTHTTVTTKTTLCCHRCNTHCSEPQISLHAMCTLVMSLSVRKYNISAGKVTLLCLSTFKHWTIDVGVPKVPSQFMKFLFDVEYMYCFI